MLITIWWISFIPDVCEPSDEEMEEECAICLVWKTSRDGLGIISDCRRGTACLAQPPSADLVGGRAMSDIWVDAGGFLEGAVVKGTPGMMRGRRTPPFFLARRPT